MPSSKEQRASGWVSVSEILGYFIEPTLCDWKVRTGAKESRRIGTVATKIGTRVHELIENDFKNGVIKLAAKDVDEVRNCIEAYRRWKEDYSFVIEQMEQSVQSDAQKVIGHYDIFGQKTLLDIKTSSKINDKMWLQVNKYAQMRGGCDNVAILRLDKNLGIYEFEKRPISQHCVDVFDAMLLTYRYFNNDPMGQGASNECEDNTAKPTV